MSSVHTGLAKSNGTKIIKTALIVFAAILFSYTIICVSLYVVQDKLIFFPQELSREVVSNSADVLNGVEDIELAMKDGNKIRGWFINNNKYAQTNLLIYFGGNAEEVSHLVSEMKTLSQWSVVLVNYRGYGSSDGTTGESTMYSDSLEIYDYFCKKDNINQNRIAVMGRSIGTGVASYLAANRKTTAVILVSPYDTLASVVQEMYPVFPANMILKYKFDTVSRAPSITSPLLIITGTEDTTIPPWHSRKVAEKWAGKVSFKEIAGEDHNSLSQTTEYWESIRDFLEQWQK